jgi:hypothetical protein
MIHKVSSTGYGWADSVHVIPTEGTFPSRLATMVWFAENFYREEVQKELCALEVAGKVSRKEVDFVLKRASV